MNILESLSGVFGDELVTQASKYLGEQPSALRSAIGSAAPALLAGLMQKASTTQGAADLFRTVTGPSVDAGLLGNLAGLFSGGDRTSALLNSGGSLLSSFLGSDKLGSLGSAIASLTGMKSTSVSSLLAMATPLLLGFLKKQVGTQGLDASGLANLLLGQKSHLERAGLDSSILRALGLGSLANLPGAARAAAKEVGAAARDVAAPKASGLARWWPWLLGLIVLLLLWQWLGRSKPVVSPPSAPAPESTAPAPAPAAWPGKVYFATGSADLDAEANGAVTAIAQLAKNEDASVEVTGYTDKTGDAAANEELAKNRAQNVRAALIAAGLAEDKVMLQPPVFITGGGEDAEARRVEVNRAP